MIQLRCEVPFATCPRCGRLAAMIPIVFGYPSAEMVEHERAGRIALGGCIQLGEDPTHRCGECGEDVILAEGATSEYGAAPTGGTWCVTCHLPFDGDPDEDPTGDAGLPICGECDRARNFDADVEEDWFEE